MGRFGFFWGFFWWEGGEVSAGTPFRQSRELQSVVVAPDKSGYPVIYLQFYTYVSQDSLGLYKVSPTRKSLRPLQNFPL